MKLINSSGNSLIIFVTLRIKGKTVAVRFLDPTPGWFRIFQKPSGKYIGIDSMHAPKDWVFVESYCLSDHEL